MENISQIQIGQTIYNIADATVRNFIKEDGSIKAEQIKVSGEYPFTYQSEIIDTSQSNNGLSTGETRYLRFLDKEGRYYAWVTGEANTNGSTNVRITARNFGTGANVDNTLNLYVANDGTRSIGVSDSSIWRSALGLGTTPVGTILWSGKTFMFGSQTAQLSHNISTCPTGIVLHWQAYVSSTAQNYDHNYTFIPKTHTNGSGATCFLGTAGPGKLGVKYLYISNDKITGNDANDDTGSKTPGITVTNNYWVLTQVIAV